MQIEAGKYYRTRDGRGVGPANAMSKPVVTDYAWSVDGTAYCDDGSFWSDRENSKHDLVAEWVDAAPALPTPHIVAIVDNGRPLPATRPYIHPNRDAALAEARRLAAITPGSEFAVYERVAGVVSEISLREVA